MASPKITTTDQRRIEIMLKKWTTKLTWDALVKKIYLELGLKTTRQTLCTYTGINTEYKNSKALLRGSTPSVYSSVTASDVKLAQQVENLKAEVKILKRNNSEQLRMIERMLANASSIPNIDLDALVRRRPEEISKN